MVSVYSVHYLYDEDNCRSVEVGDVLSNITFVNTDFEEVSLKDVQISSISREKVILEDNDFNEYIVLIDDIVSFEC